jgi:hypothetical protein
MITIRVRTGFLRHAFDEEARKQIRFATSQAINATAKLVQSGERENLKAVLDKPTPFTLNAIGIQRSSKKTLTATVFMKDITAGYLAPYELGGLNKLNSAALLVPITQKVNQYGNLPRNTTAGLRDRPDVFVGKPMGWVNAPYGFWKRFKYVKAARRKLTKKHAAQFGRKYQKQRPPELLIMFDDAHEATQRLNYRALAKKIVRQNFAREFQAAMKKAIANKKVTP